MNVVIPKSGYTSASMYPAAISFPAAAKWAMVAIAAQWLAIPVTSRQALTALLMFMGIDIVTGLWVAIIQKQVSSVASAKGVSKKFATVALLLFCHLLEKSIGIEMNLEFAGALGYSINEAISIVENFSRLGVPIPQQLVEALLSVQKLRVKSASPEDIAKLDPKESTK